MKREFRKTILFCLSNYWYIHSDKFAKRWKKQDKSVMQSLEDTFSSESRKLFHYQLATKLSLNNEFQLTMLSAYL